MDVSLYALLLRPSLVLICMPLAGFGRMPLLFESRRSATAYANARAAKRPTCVVQVLAYVDKQGILLATVTYPDGSMDCRITLQVLNRLDFSLETTKHTTCISTVRGVFLSWAAQNSTTHVLLSNVLARSSDQQVVSLGQKACLVSCINSFT